MRWIVLVVVGGLCAAAGAQDRRPPDPTATPPLPRRYLAPRTDPAGRSARSLARRVQTFPNYRAAHGGFGQWTLRPDLAWSIRAEADCLSALATAGVDARRMRWTPTDVPTPVEVRGQVAGVRFEKTRDVPLFLACEMAARLPTIAEVVREHGVDTVHVLSAYRREPPTSFHSVGLGLDLSRFTGPEVTLSVEEHWEPTPGRPTCASPPESDPRARALWDIACALASSGALSTVLTPAYPGHEDHLHLDARPDDPRFFVR